MKFLQDNKLYLGGIVLAVGSLWFYMTYFSGPPTDASLTTAATSPLSPDVLIVLSSLHTLRLDPAIFEDPLFKSLTDYGVAIPPQNAGRRNPFAPL